MAKPKIATTAMCGCFGCHMSLLDIDDRILQLIELVEFDKSPINDIKAFTGRCDIGIVEGSVSNDENVHVLQQFRTHCDILVALGGCACNGDIPSMRNTVSLRECLEEAYLNGPTVYNPDRVIPNDPEIPLMLDRVYPCNEVVKIDYFLPGCPPRADAIWAALLALIEGKEPELSYEVLKYD